MSRWLFGAGGKTTEHVAPQLLGERAQQVRAHAQLLEAEVVAPLTQAEAAHGAQWHGAARERYAALHRRLVASLQHTQRQVEGMGGALAQSAGGYTQLTHATFGASAAADEAAPIETEYVAGPGPDLTKAKEQAQRVVDNAKIGKITHASHYHGKLPSDLEQRILSAPEAVYVTTGKETKFIFRIGDNVVITRGPGSGWGNVITSYGPGGPRGDSGVAIFGGSPNDPGLPVTNDMIIKGQIPLPGGGFLPPGILIIL